MNKINRDHWRVRFKTAVKRLLKAVSCNLRGFIMGYTANESTLSSIFGINKFSIFEQS